DPRRLLAVPLLERPAQAVQRDGPVPVLAALVPGGHPGAGGKMDEPNRRLRGVLVLPAGTTGAERLDAALCHQRLITFGDRHVRRRLRAAVVRPPAPSAPEPSLVVPPLLAGVAHG